MGEKVDRAKMAELLDRGVERKMSERDRIALSALEDPGKGAMYVRILSFLDLDIRYYRMAACYYRDDMSPLEDGSEEDLLTLISNSRILPKDYADYLRCIDPDARAEEKATHKVVEGMKQSMLRALEAGV